MAKNHHIDHHTRRNILIFGGLTAVSAAGFVYGLISNGNGAVERYNRLLAADEAGGDVDTALNELRSYIYSHMNTEIGGPNGIYPPIQLKGTYDRLVAAEQKRVSDTNEKLQPEAIAFCEAQNPAGFSGRYRIECIAEYVDTHGTKAREIEDALYKYDFVAPRWSPDLAGFSLLGIIFFGLFTAFSIFTYLRTKHLVHLAN